MKEIDNKGIQCAPCTCYFAFNVSFSKKPSVLNELQVS